MRGGSSSESAPAITLISCKLGRRGIDLMHLHDAVGEIELGITATHAGHVAVDNRAELILRLRLELAGIFALVGDEAPRKQALAPNGFS